MDSLVVEIIGIGKRIFLVNSKALEIIT